MSPRLRLTFVALLAACATPPPAVEVEAPPPPTYAKKVHPPLTAPATCVQADLPRREDTVASTDGVSLFVVSIPAFGARRGAVVLTHGAGSPSSSIWDLPGGYSMMRRLACAGFDTYAVDVRGFGGSSPPPADASGRPAARPPHTIPWSHAWPRRRW